MSPPTETANAERRARRLIALYPREWRERYGEEFAALIIDEIAECPRAPRRTCDIVRCALREQLGSRGASGDRAAPLTRLRAATAITALASAPFLLLALAIWSQLAVSWRWADPHSAAIHGAMSLMLAAIAGLAAVCLLAGAPIAWSVLRGLLQRPRALALPLVLSAVGTTGIVLGSRHFGQTWPGTGGHTWDDQGLVPAQVASLAWAATLWVTSYWAHPSALGAFTGGRLLWMLASPAAWVCVLAGIASGVRRSGPLSTRVLRFEAYAGAGAVALMTVFLAGACAWLFAAPAGHSDLFRTGVIDAAAVTTMGAILILATSSARRAISTRPAGRVGT